MVDVIEDQNIVEQVFQFFREVVDGKLYVMEMDLRYSFVLDEVIDYLVDIMFVYKGLDIVEDRGQLQYDYILFMEKMINENDE